MYCRGQHTIEIAILVAMCRIGADITMDDMPIDDITAVLIPEKN